MEGVFGGAEIRVFDWLHLLGEYDTKESNFGIRLLTPENLFNFPVSLGFTAKTSDYDYSEFDLAFMMELPLGFERHEEQECIEEESILSGLPLKVPANQTEPRLNLPEKSPIL